MRVRGITLSLAALFAVGAWADEAAADHRPTQRRVYSDEGYYGGPPFIRMVPGLRIFFGDYALTEEEFDALYGNDRRYSERYDEDEPAPPVKRKKTEKKKAAKPAKPAAKAGAGDQTASIDKDNGEKATKKAPGAAGLSCEKATSVVSGYGFSSVTAESCSGKTYAFNATRDGKKFAVKLDSASGELTEVKKLP
ncbi:hypothetical protein [Aestuariivirga sp.]|uniref:hypothetical protein n=1 Tax=Aestuariivirga sp. TaxID=2650926 RepID=UPI00391C7647